MGRGLPLRGGEAMKTTGIRHWMVVGMLLFLGLAVLFYHISNLLDQNVLQPLTRQQSAQTRQVMALDTAQREVAGNPASWRDPAWQTSLRARFAALGVEALVRDPSGSEVFHTGNAGAGEQPDRQVVVVESGDGGRQLGTVELFVPESNFGPPVPVLGAVLAVVLALLFVYWQMGRYVVRPLEAMSRAARRIAGGNLDFEIPESRVREVADVRDAFGAMGEGLRGSLQRQAGLEE